MQFDLLNGGDLMTLEDFKANMTYEKKTTYGIIGIIIGAFSWGIGQPAIGIMDVALLILPCIFLALPSQTTKNNKGLAIISIIILVIAFLALIGGYYYYILSKILQLILCIYGFFCAYVMTIPTEPKQIPLPNSSNINLNNNQRYDMYCSKCGQGLFNDAQFCSKCGTKIANDIQESYSHDNNEEKIENLCNECGHELDEDSKFCPECGADVTKDIPKESSQYNEEEKVENLCSECGHEVREDSKFCPECGAIVSTSDEDKLDK